MQTLKEPQFCGVFSKQAWFWFKARNAYFADWGVLGGDRQPTCVTIPSNMSLCHNIGYNKMRLPNLLEHDSLQEASQQVLAEFLFKNFIFLHEIIKFKMIFSLNWVFLFILKALFSSIFLSNTRQPRGYLFSILSATETARCKYKFKMLNSSSKNFLSYITAFFVLSICSCVPRAANLSLPVA